MNCFQIVSLTYRSQPFIIHLSNWNCCELLSDCIFDIPITTRIINAAAQFGLWIAFRLYLWHTDHNLPLPTDMVTRVVNCFQIVSLTYRSQLAQLDGNIKISCELLSDCIFDIPITTYSPQSISFYPLWIAFRLYLWHTDHNEAF